MHEDRQQRLGEFVSWAREHITGDEKGEAQIFLDRLFRAFGQKGAKEAGATLEMRVKKADAGGTAFADLVWKPIVLIEMKKRGVDLSRHYRQAFDYWTRLVPGRPRYVVLCNFDEFWVYDFETQMDSPLDMVTLEQLPERWGPLAFLFPGKVQPTFGNDHEAVTRKAADLLAQCFTKLVTRRVERVVAQRFTLQMLVALFAEDIGLLDKYFVTQLLDDCKEPADSFDLLGGLFVAMNSKKNVGGRFKGVDYFNGGLFAEPARLELYPDELNQLRRASKSDWSQVRPEIFGTLFEHSLEKEERHAFGAHFTSPVDIMKIVGPTIVEPWREQIENATTIKRLNELLGRIHSYRVLDPACGSGNFLYIAYRELKRLEATLVAKIAQVSKRATTSQIVVGFVTAEQFFGLDINPFAVELAKVTMMIARKLAIDELHTVEPALPLDNLDKNFLTGDALLDSQGNAATWPKSDVIIGNPPFLDARKMTVEFGRKYVGAIESVYPQVPRRADYCTYWFRKAHDALPECTVDDPVAGRAGLVGTQNIRNNQSRIGGLDYILKSGTIVEAVDNQPWSGEANVHVSIANWIKTHSSKLVTRKPRLWFQVKRTGDAERRKRGQGSASKEFELDTRIVDHINSSLSDKTDVSAARRLACNRTPKKCFEGQQPGHKGFRIERAEYLTLRQAGESTIIFPYLNGTELLTDKLKSAPRYIIDFGDMDLLHASKFSRTLEIVQKRVLPKWQQNANSEKTETGRTTGEHQNRMDTWWQLKRRRPELINVISNLNRYIVCARVTKRPVFAFVASAIHPDSSLSCFTLSDDYSFGILQSSAHWLWFTTKCSKLTERFRYTPDTVFDTFPWPQATTKSLVDAVAIAGRKVRAIRADVLQTTTGGLRRIYRTLELPGKSSLKDAHAALNAAVLNAYGFSPKKDLLDQLLQLNLTIAARITSNQPVVSPGVPPNYRDPARLVTDDCIRAD